MPMVEYLSCGTKHKKSDCLVVENLGSEFLDILPRREYLNNGSNKRLEVLIKKERVKQQQSAWNTLMNMLEKQFRKIYRKA